MLVVQRPLSIVRQIFSEHLSNRIKIAFGYAIVYKYMLEYDGDILMSHISGDPIISILIAENTPSGQRAIGRNMSSSILMSLRNRRMVIDDVAVFSTLFCCFS